MAEKLVLVPEAVLNLNEKQLHQQKPLEKKLSALDKEIESILQRDIPSDEKVKRYYQVLDQYIEYYKQTQAKSPVPVRVTSQDLTLPRGNTDQEIQQLENILQDLPQSSREKAGRLLRYLQRSPNFKWDAQRQLILDDKVIPGSNVTDLLYDAVRQGKTQVDQGPRGSADFYNFMHSSNVPGTLLNKPGRQKLEYSPKVAAHSFDPKKEQLSPITSKKSPARKRTRASARWEDYH